ncbi:MAG: DUF86 domain-containing protein [Candidatus Aenigmatarchaeota archaeon]
MDEKRILAKIDELDSYRKELEEIMPQEYEDYVSSTETKRACERLLHIMIETVIDICNLIVKELKLGLPGEEEDFFNKLQKKGILSRSLVGKLKSMKGFRNILVHRYDEVDDELVFRFLRKNLGDFDSFRKEIIAFLEKFKG